jgi:cell wall-associated NlpC family hydrolase
MTPAFLRASLKLWLRKHAYRQRKLNIAHQANNTASIEKWNALLVTAGKMIRRRRAQLDALARGVTVTGNKATGGTPRQRIVAAARMAAKLHATGKRHSFYSQPGKWTVDYGITGEPLGYRSDCSQFVTSMYHAAGLPDPNGTDYTGGYTGTLAEHGKYISRADLKAGDLVLYGPAPHHHVELYVGPGDDTIGHGSPPVDRGTITMMPEVHFVTYPFLG